MGKGNRWAVYALDDPRRVAELDEDLRAAANLLETENDNGLAAATEAVWALVKFADLIGPYRSEPIQRLLYALDDVRGNVRPAMFDVKYISSRVPSERAEFNGQLAGMIEVLGGAVGNYSAVFRGEGAARSVIEKAQVYAARRGWMVRDLSGLHAEVITEWKDGTGHRERHGPGRKGAPRTIDRLRAAPDEEPLNQTDLGKLRRERFEALMICRLADMAARRGEDVGLWCEFQANRIWSESSDR
ncbi:MAG: hypothetical protein JNM89_09205 [Hyphomicrobiaceae bacterium]|nr:hypothetical protein [Hyphomicrobiaceae bacterium]